jgi:hypothetical protein
MLTFRFSSVDGPVRALTMAVVDLSNEQFVWTLSSARGTHLSPIDPALQQRARSMAEHLDVEKLATSTPDQLRAVAERVFGSEGNAVVEAVRYGQVPDGFKQDFPRKGAPQLLHAGVTYAVCLWGAFNGSHPFEVREHQ